jgi:hypothetical protein
VTSDAQEWRDWAAGWHDSEGDAQHHRPHRPDPRWSTARQRGYQAEAERRRDWRALVDGQLAPTDTPPEVTL